MIKNMKDLFEAIGGDTPIALVAAAGEEEDLLMALDEAMNRGWIQATVVGDRTKIADLMKKQGIRSNRFTVIHGEDPVESVALAMEQVRDGKANILMKGKVGTADVLRGVLNREYGQRQEKILSHMAMVETEGVDRLLFITDGGVVIAPDLDQKRQILENAVDFVQSLGYDKPNVGVICAVEKVNEKMPATLDAIKLVDLAKEGVIKGCNVSGPFALDNALSERSAKIKGIRDPFAGRSDILLMPSVEAGNILFKALVYLAPSKTAAVVLGAKVPIVLTSRSDRFETKLHSIAAAVYMVQQQEK
ncbi:phosphate butyryltransferase [Alkalibacter rhizosphaerae]|uniref:Phosphate butyryltransferase n=1 Tax=Alkalibacter rhizosphaerae TaxID=2815577 RepID=A0A974XFQ8_9FIRM|nr:phosphate acyltransferase [Alkalibacter rhizosphaerae]QSX08871.1 phosphate butyryltransferase [Alkalibacter rhizosphaerae]